MLICAEKLMNRLYHCSMNMHGVLLLDKPKGLSSNNVVQIIKNIYNATRAGHTGTLDPLATGMLLVCLGEATKFSQYLLCSDKRYQVIAKLGQRTDTSDAYGKIIQERPITFSKAHLNTSLESFRGELLQIPSMYSAIKYQGKKLYEYARKGIKIPRTPRYINIYELLLIRYEETELELEIHCSKGTYIRTIIDDLGEKLGCGAHVVYLRRKNIGNYPVERMVTIGQIQKLLKQSKEKKILASKLLHPLIIPIDNMMSGYPNVNLSKKLSIYFKRGNLVQTNIFSIRGKIVRVTEGEEETFIGMGKIDDKGYVFPRRLFVSGL